MAKLAFAVAFLLVTVASAFRIEDIEERREYDEGTPEMLRERGLIPEYDDDPDVYRDTAWLLDRIIMDGAEVVPAVVIYRFGSGKKQECIDGKKTIPAQCQWTGWVIEEEGGNPVETKLTVSKKYCNADGHTKPEDKVIDC